MSSNQIKGAQTVPKRRQRCEERDLFVTLEEIYKGCSKPIQLDRKTEGCDSKIHTHSEKKYNVSIPPGTEAGTKIFCNKDGHQIQDAESAEIAFIIRDEPHSHFEREKSNVIHVVKLTEQQARSGEDIAIPTPDGHGAAVRCSTQKTDSVRIIPNRGLPIPGKHLFGDLIVKFEIAPGEVTHTTDDLPPIEIKVPITLEEVLKGTTKQVKINKGLIYAQLNGRQEQEEIHFSKVIAPGAQAGTKYALNYPKEPNGVLKGCPVIVLEDAPHSKFQRDNNDIIFKALPKDISQTDDVHIQSLDGEDIVFKANNFEGRTFENRGLPFLQDANKRGNLVVQFESPINVERKSIGENMNAQITKSPQTKMNEADKQALDYPIFVTLEEILNGCTKEVLIGNEMKEIQIKPGTVDGTKIQLSDNFIAHSGRKTTGIECTIKVLSHPQFKRDGNNICHMFRLKKGDPNREIDASIPMLDGQEIKLHKFIVNSSSVLVIPGGGLPFVDEPNKRGALHVNFKFEVEQKD